MCHECHPTWHKRGTVCGCALSARAASKRRTVAEHLRGEHGRIAALPLAQLAEDAAEAQRYATAALVEVVARPLREARRPADPQALMTAQQVAHYLGLSRSEVYRLAKEGWLKPAAVLLGKGTLRFHRGTLDRLLEDRRGV